MHCTNCGQEVPAGSNVCPYCGAPVAQAAPPAVTPPVQVTMPGVTMPAAMPGMAMPAPAAGSNGLSIASLVLGILGILLIVLAVVLTYTIGANIIDQFGGNANVSQQDIMQLAQDPAFQANAMGIFISAILAMLLSLIGFILGIVGVSRESRQPTASGKAIGIIGLVISALPLLCCAVFLVIGLLGQGAA